MIEETAGKSIPAIFAEDGEDAFRTLESDTVRQFGMSTGCVISTGGGIVTREENYASLHRNGVILHLARDLDRLPAEGRPLSLQQNVNALWQQRKDLYRQFSDHVIDNNASPEETMARIIKELDQG